VERDKSNKSESVGQTLPQLPWRQKKGEFKKKLDSFHHFGKINPYRHNFTWHIIFLQGFIKFDQGISEKCVGQTFDGRKKERKKERRNIVGIFTVVCGSFWRVEKFKMALPWKLRYQNNGVG
jgi:hypothetical protein